MVDPYWAEVGRQVEAGKAKEQAIRAARRRWTDYDVVADLSEKENACDACKTTRKWVDFLDDMIYQGWLWRAGRWWCPSCKRKQRWFRRSEKARRDLLWKP